MCVECLSTGDPVNRNNEIKLNFLLPLVYYFWSGSPCEQWDFHPILVVKI